MIMTRLSGRKGRARQPPLSIPLNCRTFAEVDMNNTGFYFGVGINDADYKINKHEYSGGKWRVVWVCPYYRTWRDMLTRCYGESFHKRCPWYKGCSVVDSWAKFSEFKAWMEAQEWEGKHLDKDLLIPGNRVYSPDSCIFISRELNVFLSGTYTARGEFPVGVSWHKRDKKYNAQCKNPFTGKRGHIGSFDCPQEAHRAWMERKHQHACQYADMQTDQRIADALRSRFAPEGNASAGIREAVRRAGESQQ